MRRLIIGLLGAVAMSTAASAADMPVKAHIAPAPALYNWSGWYIGGNLGYGWGGSTGGGYSSFQDIGIVGVAGFFAAGGNVLPSVNPNGVLGGVQLGYNWQMSPVWVVGLVTDIQASGMTASGTGSASIGAFTGITESKTAKITWFGTVRGKVGYAMNNVLLYGTGGLAYGGVKVDTSFNDPSFGGGALVFAGSTSTTRAGWTLGAGIDYGLTPNWTIGAEYLYIDLGTVSVTETRSSGPANASTFTSDSKMRANIARVVLNYKFAP